MMILACKIGKEDDLFLTIWFLTIFVVALYIISDIVRFFVNGVYVNQVVIDKINSIDNSRLELHSVYNNTLICGGIKIYREYSLFSKYSVDDFGCVRKGSELEKKIDKYYEIALKAKLDRL